MGRTTSSGVPVELELFCATEYPPVHGFLALYIGDAGVAAELAQDAFVRVCRDWSRVEHMERPGAWVHRVAVNLANSWFRRRRAERRAVQRVASMPPPAGPHGIETAPAVRAALDELEPAVRAVIVLRYFADLTVAETAEVLGVPEGTVKTRTRRGLEELRRVDLIDDIRDDTEVGHG
jgi:RNA polymerase sigma-70 factor (sigma-E family)